jgi:hypothetical protein
MRFLPATSTPKKLTDAIAKGLPAFLQEDLFSVRLTRLSAF